LEGAKTGSATGSSRFSAESSLRAKSANGL
jgi:hypothetical protein